MPRLLEATKDAASGETRRRGASGHRPAGVRMGKPAREGIRREAEANAAN